MLTEQVIEDGSLAAVDDAFTFRLRMPWYRSLPLSSLEGLEVTLDGVPTASDELRVSLDGATYSLGDLPPLHDRWWYVADAAEVQGPVGGAARRRRARARRHDRAADPVHRRVGPSRS